jgi:hypothetical protein
MIQMGKLGLSEVHIFGIIGISFRSCQVWAKSKAKRQVHKSSFILTLYSIYLKQA